MVKRIAARRLKHLGDRGSVAIESALVVPVLLMLVAITLELGLGMYESMQVSNAVSAGTLYATKNGYDVPGITTAVTGATGTPGITATPAPTRVCGCPGASGIAVVACGPTLCPDGSPAGQYVRINASITHQKVLPSLGLPVPTTLTAQSIVRLQ